MTIEIYMGPACDLVAFTSDHHIGNHQRFAEKKLSGGINRRCAEHIDTLRRAVLTARREGAGLHVLCGDTFDNEKPAPPIISATQRALEGMQHVVMRGNHDMASQAAHDNSISPLAPVARVVEDPTIVALGNEGHAELWLVPFASRGLVLDWLPKMLAEFDETSQSLVRVLALHMGIAWEETPPWLTRGHNWIDHRELRKLCEKYNVALAVSGDWHEHKTFKRSVQIGALVPTGFDNPGLDSYGTLLLVNMRDAQAKRIVIPGPRFVQATSVASATMPEDDSTLYLEVTAPADALLEETRRLEQLRERGVIVGGEVVLDKREVELDAREAARSAKAADSLAEATVAFVDRMGLEPTVDRERVLARVKGFLA